MAHKHLRIYTRSGSVYLLCANTHKWLRLYHTPENDILEHLELEGKFPVEWEPTIGEPMHLQRDSGLAGDKYNPIVITTTAVIAIEVCE